MRLSVTMKNKSELSPHCVDAAVCDQFGSPVADLLGCQLSKAVMAQIGPEFLDPVLCVNGRLGGGGPQCFPAAHRLVKGRPFFGSEGLGRRRGFRNHWRHSAVFQGLQLLGLGDQCELHQAGRGCWPLQGIHGDAQACASCRASSTTAAASGSVQSWVSGMGADLAQAPATPAISRAVSFRQACLACSINTSLRARAES